MDPWAPPPKLVEIVETRAAELGVEIEWVHNGLTAVGRKLVVLNPEEPPPLDRVEIELDEKGSWWIAAQEVGLCDFLPPDREREATVPRDDERRAVLGDLFGFSTSATPSNDPPQAVWQHPRDNPNDHPGFLTVPEIGSIVQVGGRRYTITGTDRITSIEGSDAGAVYEWHLDPARQLPS